MCVVFICLQRKHTFNCRPKHIVPTSRVSTSPVVMEYKNKIDIFDICVEVAIRLRLVNVNRKVTTPITHTSTLIQMEKKCMKNS